MVLFAANQTPLVLFCPSMAAETIMWEMLQVAAAAGERHREHHHCPGEEEQKVIHCPDAT
jgi:hypothetical protein